MKKLLFAAVLTVLAFSSAEAGMIQKKEGVVSQINIGAGSLVLANGESYRMLNPALLYGYVPGDAVVVGYDNKKGELIGRSLYRIPDTGSSSFSGYQSQGRRA